MSEIIIVVSFNNESTIDRCIKEIVRAIGSNQKLVVVDNASTDTSVEQLLDLQRLHDFIFIPLKKNIGFGPAHNLVFQQYNAKRYILINSDAYLQNSCFMKAVSRLEDEIGIIGIPLVYPDYSYQSYWYSYSTPLKLTLQFLKADTLFKILVNSKFGGLVSSLGSRFNHSKQLSLLNKEHNYSDCKLFDYKDVDWVCGAGMIVSKQVIDATGGFDPKIFLYGEDEDICIQAKKHGFRVVAMEGVPPLIHEFGWGKNKNNRHISKLKYESLEYFYKKHFGIMGSVWAIFILKQMLR